MKKLRIDVNFAIFIIFFGIALIEAIQKQIFMALGIMFLRADK
jgi:hypothetical protein